MLGFLKPHRTDLKYLSALLLVSSIPMVVLRCFLNSGTVWRQLVLWSSVATALRIVWLWRRATASLEIPEPVQPPQVPTPGLEVRRGGQCLA